MWFGTDGRGLNNLNMKTNKFTSFSVKDGLPDKSIKAILEDDDYNLWISTTNGLSKFNPKTRSFHNYDFTDGLQDYSFSSAHCKSSDGRLLFGGPNGFNIFNPKSFKTNNNPPQVVITDFKVYNSSVAVGQEIDGNIILKKTIFDADTIILSHQINIFAIEFAALDFTNPEKNKYAYKMEGFDNQWQNTNAKNRTATYTNLDPGTYTFRVRASNNDGIWNEHGASISITILPPWWKTKWFKLLILLIFISSIYFAYYLRVEMYRKKEKELTVLVRQRTQEISQANNILLERQTRIEEYAEELRTHTENLSEANSLLKAKQILIETQAKQLQDTNEQLLVLNSTKDRFFSIIAHDLRNPFHTVSGFAEILINDYKKLSPEKIERFLSLIYTSSLSGHNLLENLLQWSRSQTGRISYSPAKLNLTAIAEETISLLEGNARSKNITLQSLIDQNITVLADENMLKTIFRNLVSNAIKFTPENGTVTIKAASSNLQVEVTVADTGVGIPKENLSLLFRIDATVTTKGTANEAGTGLGLILCKEFIEKHHGKIWVESEEGKGSQFKFTLPLC
jgi:signal transduction histidine kinase